MEGAGVGLGAGIACGTGLLCASTPVVVAVAGFCWPDIQLFIDWPPCGLPWGVTAATGVGDGAGACCACCCDHQL